MKIKCGFCDGAFDAMSEKCPHCGAANDKAALYANQHEHNMRIKEQAKREAVESAAVFQAKAKKIVFTVYGIIAVVVCLPIIVGIILAVDNHVRERQERADRAKQKQEQIVEEQRLKEEEELASKAYDEEIIAVSGINEVAQKDKYFSVQVTDVIPYELYYDHNERDWGSGFTDNPYLYDNEHRVAIGIKLKNYQDRMSIYGEPCEMVKLYIEDEKEDSIVIQDDNFLNGSDDDNYYSGGDMISNNGTFSDNYGKTIEKNQNMSWWVPIVVSENCEKIILHFDHNMSITVDNPCYKQ